MDHITFLGGWGVGDSCNLVGALKKRLPHGALNPQSAPEKSRRIPGRRMKETGYSKLVLVRAAKVCGNK